MWIWNWNMQINIWLFLLKTLCAGGSGASGLCEKQAAQEPTVTKLLPRGNPLTALLFKLQMPVPWKNDTTVCWSMQHKWLINFFFKKAVWLDELKLVNKKRSQTRFQLNKLHQLPTSFQRQAGIRDKQTSAVFQEYVWIYLTPVPLEPRMHSLRRIQTVY